MNPWLPPLNFSAGGGAWVDAGGEGGVPCPAAGAGAGGGGGGTLSTGGVFGSTACWLAATEFGGTPWDAREKSRQRPASPYRVVARSRKGCPVSSDCEGGAAGSGAGDGEGCAASTVEGGGNASATDSEEEPESATGSGVGTGSGPASHAPVAIDTMRSTSRAPGQVVVALGTS